VAGAKVFWGGIKKLVKGFFGEMFGFQKIWIEKKGGRSSDGFYFHYLESVQRAPL